MPAQYEAAKPASLMVFNDGHAFKNPAGNVRAHNVLDEFGLRLDLFE